MSDRAALYMRVSTRQQADKHGVRYQREALQQLAAARGWHVVHTFQDEGYSGRKERRPGLDALMAAVERGEVNIVAVWRFDRLARSLIHLVSTLDRFRKLNVQFVSHQEAIDTGSNNPLGQAMFQMAAIFAELESNLARERTTAAMAAAKARGVKMGRPEIALSHEEAVELVRQHGGFRPAGRATGIHFGTIRNRYYDR